MKYITIFHANLNYAYLTPDRYEFVIRQSYEMLLDTMAERFPTVPFVFEASGYTIEQMAQHTPDVLDKLKAAIANGTCEFMGSPYAHPMLPNFPEEDGLWTLRFSNEVYDKHLGMQPTSFWNPECGWRHYVPRMVAAAGYANMIGDFEAYSRSLGPDGKPQRPEVYAVEHSDTPAFYRFGFAYDLPGDEKAIHFPFDNVPPLGRGDLRVFLRTDRIAQYGVRYFMGMDGYTLENYLGLIRTYSAQQPGEPEGALIVFADDAEYVGTNGWFRLKYQNQPDRVFEPTPESRQKLIDLVTGCLMIGSFTTFADACATLPPLPEPIRFDDDSAWHGARASTWASTPMARLLRPWQDLVREKVVAATDLNDETHRRAWYHLTNSYNSDGQWPPTLPDAPHIVHPFNYEYCFENLREAESLVGGIDHDRLSTDPIATLTEILSPQQALILRKAEQRLQTDDATQRAAAQEAKALIARAQVVDSLNGVSHGVLTPEEYTWRAEATVEARRLVDGIQIEAAATTK
ncbi:MAG: hypothetical protein JXA69_16605 [Phycisphaerae bacterium]|nr:hypothetical protein [Phycisphaerae bacterium]